MKPKSLRELSLNLPEQEYHDLPIWSQSVIAKYARDGFSAISTLHDKVTPTPSMEFGSLFDSFITRGKETLEHYMVSDVSVTPAEKNVLDVLATSSSYNRFADIPMEEVLNVAASVNYRPDYKKPETRYNHIAEFGDYYDAKRTGKKIVSRTDWDDAVEMFGVFRNDSYLKNLFGTKDTNDVEYIYQAQFKTTFVVYGKEVEVKMMADLIIVNHSAKTIQIVDLKTSSMPAYDFSQNFLKFRYDIEAELYTDVVEKIANENGYADYEILPFLFTDISRVDKVPVTYTYDPVGGLVYIRGEKTYEYKGWKELLAEILNYEEQNAKVPDYITTDGPNDLIEILER